jgi:hypothetical protein
LATLPSKFTSSAAFCVWDKAAPRIAIIAVERDAGRGGRQHRHTGVLDGLQAAYARSNALLDRTELLDRGHGGELSLGHAKLLFRRRGELNKPYGTPDHVRNAGAECRGALEIHDGHAVIGVGTQRSGISITFALNGEDMPHAICQGLGLGKFKHGKSPSGSPPLIVPGGLLPSAPGSFITHLCRQFRDYSR